MDNSHAVDVDETLERNIRRYGVNSPEVGRLVEMEGISLEEWLTRHPTLVPGNRL